MRAPRFFAPAVRTSYDFNAVNRIATSAVWLSLVVGCASPMSAMRDDNKRLSKTVAELRADRRAQERKLRDLQRQLDLVRAQVATAVIDGAPPSLPVEVAGPVASPSAASGAPPLPDGARIVGVTEDGTEIVYEGDAAAGRVATLEPDSGGTGWPSDPPAPRRVRRGADSYAPARAPQLPSTHERGEQGAHRLPAMAARTVRPPTRDRAPLPAERTPDANNAYRAAVELVRGGDHAGAVTAFRAFLTTHPRHDYADNAQYWLGEAYYAQQDYARALVEFRTVIETYPRGNKVPDALLKVGYCYQALGQAEKARAVLEQVVNLYPKTEPAAIAAKRLETP